MPVEQFTIEPTHSLEEFEERLKATPIPQKIQSAILKAARARYAWQHGYADEWEGLDCLVNRYGHYLLETGDCAWVSSRGETFYCHYGVHDEVAAIFFGMKVHDFEKEFARVTKETKAPEDAYRYVDRPTPRMKRAVLELFTANETIVSSKGFAPA